MNPWKIFLFFISVLLILLLVTLISKPVILDGMRSEDGFRAGKMIIKYPTIESFSESGKPEDNTKADSVITLIGANVPDKDIAPVVPDFTNIDTAAIERISYPAGSGNFPKSLRELLESGSCRILHYGDSQIEGDRISGFLRNRLQGIYGGSGPGFIPIRQVYEHMSAEVIASDNWLRFAAFDPTQRKVSDKNYGLYASLSRFTAHDHYAMDSARYDSLGISKASIVIRPSKKSYPGLRRFNRIGLHYGNSGYPVKVTVKSGEQQISESSLIADKAYHCFEIRTENTPDEITIELEGKVSPDFYGLTLDGSGVLLDNIAMRGGSGTIFSTLNSESFKAMSRRLNPKIVIFQYGGNTIPYMKDSLGISNYSRFLAGNIKWVKRQIPDAMILFIGPSDMSTVINGEMVTYPLLPYLDEKLKQTCNENGWAYWSMFNAMGGENSMPHWVNQGLAANDYTHFSPKGTRIISELFFTALYLDLKK
ncbi:MAG: hypothetical protein FD170_497 [Bacteroidetes bacterium]|nr:MAG: hypothetical protein FD170_497 [Bacteroidota bacterium]